MTGSVWPSGERLIARLVLVSALLLLGVVAAFRLPLSFLPSQTFPELLVQLRLAEESELEAVTRQWVVPAESAIRAVSGVRGMAGEVSTRGGRWTVRFRSGVDIERKAARLQSELGVMRRSLPAGSSVAVRPAGREGGENAAVLWLPEAIDSASVARLRDLPEVRSVEVAGRARPGLEVLEHGAREASLGSALTSLGRVERLGRATTDGRRLPVWTSGRRGSLLGEDPIRRGSAMVPVRSVAELRLGREESPWTAHLQGREGFVLLIDRELDISPLRFDRALRRGLAEVGLGDRVRFVRNEAEPLQRLLVRCLGGLLVAVLLLITTGAVTGGWRLAVSQGLALPVALAVALNALWLAGAGLHVTTLPALMVGLACSLLFLAVRRTVAGGWSLVAGALALSLAVALAGGRLAPLVAEPARVFAVALIAGGAALLVLPMPVAKSAPPRAFGWPLRIVLRDPFTTLLAAVTLAYLLLVFSGRALSPRPGSLTPALADLSVVLRFPEGTTREQAGAQVAAVESHLGGLEEVAEHWAMFNRAEGWLTVRLRPEARAAGRLRRLAGQLEVELRSQGAAARVLPLTGGGRRESSPLRFSDELEERPEVDRELSLFRFLLRGSDLDHLEKAHFQLRELMAKKMRRTISDERIRSDWGTLETRVELVPRAGVFPRQVDRVLPALRRRTTFPGTRPLLAGGSGDEEYFLRVLPEDSPRDAEKVQQRDEILTLLSSRGSPLAPTSLFEAREVVIRPWVQRQSGRFVLPVAVRLPASVIEARREEQLMALHHLLHTAPLPTGIELALPELDPYAWGPEQWRLAAVACALPLLLLVVAICRLDAVVAAVAAVVSPLLGTLAAAPFILASGGNVDEMTLLGLAMAAAGVLPLALEVAAAWQAVPVARPRSGGIAYRWLARRWPGIIGCTLALGALLAVPGLGLDNERNPWCLPLRAAAVAAVVGCLASCLLLPAMLQAVARLRQLDRREQRRRVQPPEWATSEGLELRVRNLTKIYGNGFRALQGVEFQLEPGIVGLLGPNGAGKTTLLRLLCGLIEPSRGQIRFHGVPITPENLPGFRRRVGFLPQEFNAYEGFTGEQFLDYWALEKGFDDVRERRREVEQLLVRVGLEEAAGRRVRDFSGGMRRRIGIARALLGAPPIVLVDEPTTGLDVESRNRLRETLLRAAGERIILFSTHIASDVAATASRILLLDRGRLIFDGPAKGLIDLARGRVFEALLEDHELRAFSSLYQVTTRVRTLDGIRVRAVARDDQDPAGPLVDPNLEEAYLAMITDRAARSGGGPSVGGPSVGGQSAAVRPASLLDVESWRS